MKIKGIITAMVTPFDDNGQINKEATKKLIEKLIGGGVHGIFILGTNGEFHVMEERQKLELAETVVEYVDKRVPVFAGAGACGTDETIRLIKAMKAVGADAVSAITPYFQKLSQKELEYHYQTIANSVDLPILIYNIPSLTQNPVGIETVGKLCNEQNIAGIKDSSGDLQFIKGCIDVSAGADFVVLSGSDSLILKSLKIGAAGAIAATSNLLTEIDVAIYNCFIDGDLEQAQVKQDSIEALRKVLKRGVQPSVIKRALELSGYPVGKAKKPISDISSEVEAEIVDMLSIYKIKVEV